MRDRKIFTRQAVPLAGTLIAALLMISCAGQDDRNRSAISNGVDIPVMPTTTVFVEQETETNERSFKAIVVDVNVQDKKLILQDVQSGTRIPYEYTGGTKLLSRFDQPVTMDRIALGEVVEAWTVGGSTKLSGLKISDADFDYTEVTNFKIDKERKTITVGNERYRYTDQTVFMTKDSEISIDKVESVDKLRLRGVDQELDSVIVTEGHGYLRLDSTTFFEGGYLEIGDKIVEVITENMVIAVPTGRFNVTVTKDQTIGSKELVIAENEEVRLNLTEFQSTAVRLGALSIKISPKGAKLTIDGEEKDYSGMIDLPYGNHKLVVTADGYEPYAQVIAVNSITSEYNIMLVKEGEASEGDASGEQKETDEQTNQTQTGSSETASKSASAATGESKKASGNSSSAGRTGQNPSTRGSYYPEIWTTRPVRETTMVPTLDYNSLISGLLE